MCFSRELGRGVEQMRGSGELWKVDLGRHRKRMKSSLDILLASRLLNESRLSIELHARIAANYLRILFRLFTSVLYTKRTSKAT